MKKILVSYFSASGVTARVAQKLSQAIDGDLHEIIPAQPYSQADLDWTNPQSRSSQEMKNKAYRPAIQNEVKNMDDYDVIFLGYPNWWGDLPMPLYTILETYDFAGKTIVPFVTHGGSGFSRTISTIQSLQPDATVLEDGLSIPRGNVVDAAQEAMDWAAGLNLA